MTRRSTRALLLLGSLMLILTSCGPGRAESDVAVNASPAPTAAKPSPTRAPKPKTPTPQPPTTTPVPPTAEPTSEPSPAPDNGANTATMPQSPPVNMPAGWNYYDKSSVGFTFALPPQWNVVDLDREDAQELIEKMMTTPEMSGLGGSTSALLAQGIKIIACDCNEMGQAGVMPVTLNVITQSKKTSIPFEHAVQGAIQSLEAMPFTIKPINHTRIPHPSADAEAIQYRMRLSDQQGNARTFTATQYVLMSDGNLVLVSITASIAKAEALTPTFYKIIQTFRLTSFTTQPM